MMEPFPETPASSDPFRTPPARIKCRHCGGVIGVYEPLVALTSVGPLRTSLVIDPDLLRSGYACYHLACHELLHGSIV